MARLTSVNFQKLQNCILAIYSNQDMASLPNHIVSVISNAIPSSVSSYAKINHNDQNIIYTGMTSCRKWEELGAFSRCMHEHPFTNFLHSESLGRHRFRDDIEMAVQKRYPHLKHSHHNTVAKISDVLSGRQFRSLAIYNDFFRPNGVDFQLLVSLMPSPDGYTTISFNRDKIDFSEQERLLLHLIGPHIAQAHENAEAYAKARLAFAVSQGSGQTIRTDNLTYREEDVLCWVAQGKTNGEVAKILNIAPGTVKVHLERIYHKLGVDNRTSAAMFVAGGKKQP
jgi:DNA-binding CsgD family transcriptional regulator